MCSMVVVVAETGCYVLGIQLAGDFMADEKRIVIWCCLRQYGYLLALCRFVTRLRRASEGRGIFDT